MIDARPRDPWINYAFSMTVAETGSFSAAARRLRRVQSADQPIDAGVEATLCIRRSSIAAPSHRSSPTPVASCSTMLATSSAASQMLRARAESMAAEVEPELTLAVDAMFPSAILMTSSQSAERDLPVPAGHAVHRGAGRAGAAPARRCRRGLPSMRRCRPARKISKPGSSLRSRSPPWLPFTIPSRRSPARSRATCSSATCNWSSPTGRR